MRKRGREREQGGEKEGERARGKREREIEIYIKRQRNQEASKTFVSKSEPCKGIISVIRCTIRCTKGVQ